MKRIHLFIVLAFTIVLLGQACVPPAPTQNDTQQYNADEDSNANINSPLEQELGIIPLDPEESPKAILKTNKGDITIQFYTRHSPKTVENFLKLAKDGFYEGVKFHRVIDDFMIQTGDPNSKDDDWSDDGEGGPGYSIDDEFNHLKFFKGTVGMAKTAAPNSGGSQFFIVTNEHAEWLDGNYTLFGYVTDGIDVVDAIEAVETTGQYELPPDHPLDDVIIESIEIEE